MFGFTSGHSETLTMFVWSNKGDCKTSKWLKINKAIGFYIKHGRHDYYIVANKLSDWFNNLVVSTVH